MLVVKLKNQRSFPKGLKYGQWYEVLEVREDSYRLERDDGQRIFYPKRRFEEPQERVENTWRTVAVGHTTSSGWLIKDPTEEPMNKENWRSYSFKVRSLDQVDHFAIEEDLSWNNPLMVMEYGAKRKVFVYISETVWRKADNCGMEEELTEFITCSARYRNGWKILRSDLPKLIDILKRIKKAKWDRPRKATCVVTKVTI